MENKKQTRIKGFFKRGNAVHGGTYAFVFDINQESSKTVFIDVCNGMTVRGAAMSAGMDFIRSNYVECSESEAKHWYREFINALKL